MADSGPILSTAYDLARIAAQYAVFIAAPAAVLALVTLLMVGGYGRHHYREPEREALPALLGRVVIGSALFAGIGLFCQIMLAAQVGGIF